MITSAVNVASTFPGLWAVDKFGRRPLLFWGAIGMCVSQLIVAITGTTSSAQTATGEIYATNVAAQKAGIAFICIYIFFFASTWVSRSSLCTPSHPLTPLIGSSRMGRNW
jgi:SP family sugar:H+ symporter-like MFS transporter